MSTRELVALGTSSQVPTRYRNHNAYFLRWDREGLLFDPGEGTQRQLLLAGIPSSAITRIFITHFHGDHSLGLPGILQRLNLDGCPHPVQVYFPAQDERFFRRLRDASYYSRMLEILPQPVSGEIHRHSGGEALSIEARPLEHSVPTYGYRVTEPDAVRVLPERLDALGLYGPAVGELLRHGRIEWKGRTIRQGEVSETRRGMCFAFVMDTRPCRAAELLARDADLLLIESTYLDSEAGLAREHFHCTARQAASLARNVGVHRLALAHFSQRYGDVRPFLDEARTLHEPVIALRDLDRIPIPWGRKHAAP